MNYNHENDQLCYLNISFLFSFGGVLTTYKSFSIILSSQM